MSDHPVQDALWNWFKANWAWSCTFLLAGYGAVLSTYREWRARQDKKLDIRVSIHPRMVLMLHEPIPTIQVSGHNHGFVSARFGQSCCSLRIHGSVTGLILDQDDCKRVDSSASGWPPGDAIWEGTRPSSFQHRRGFRRESCRRAPRRAGERWSTRAPYPMTWRLCRTGRRSAEARQRQCRRRYR